MNNVNYKIEIDKEYKENIMKCKNCYYAKEFRVRNNNSNEKFFTCHFNPPVIVERDYKIDNFPIVNENSWCGKFKNINNGN